MPAFVVGQRLNAALSNFPTFRMQMTSYSALEIYEAVCIDLTYGNDTQNYAVVLLESKEHAGIRS